MKTNKQYVVPVTTHQSMTAMQIMSSSYDFDNQGDTITGE